MADTVANRHFMRFKIINTEETEYFVGARSVSLYTTHEVGMYMHEFTSQIRHISHTRNL